MTHAALSAFLRAVLPRLGLRARGFRNLQSTVKKRLSRRMADVGAADLEAYAARLEADPAEWAALDAICRIPISRFHRDAGVFERLAREILPARAQAAAGERAVRVWSAGCASGEEPYSVAMAWDLEVAPKYPKASLAIVATDVDAAMVSRAREGRYRATSLRELPAPFRDYAFEGGGDEWRLRAELAHRIHFLVEDLRTGAPPGPFDVVLCRNLAFTYFDEPTQRAVAARIIERLLVGGALIVGKDEELPPGLVGLSPRGPWVHERTAAHA
jgi:chemotaxis protein methyltransferase CheR